jgi:hypothetical protein
MFGRITERIKTVHHGEDRWRQDLIDQGTHKENSGGFTRRKSMKSSIPSLRKNKMEDIDKWSRGSEDCRSSAKGFQSFGIHRIEGAGPLVSQVVKPQRAQGLTLGHGTRSYGDPLREALKERGVLLEFGTSGVER